MPILNNNFDSPDFNQRLDNTFVRYKGVPYHLSVRREEEDSYEDYYFSLTPCNPSKTGVRINPRDKDLDISSLPLGYLSIRGSEPLFLSRTSLAMYPHKQAVATQRIVARTLNDYSTSIPKVLTKYFEDMVMNKYKDYKDAFHIMKKDKKSTPIHIHFCVRGDGFLLYKNSPIGFCVSESKVVISADERKSFLYKRYLSKFNIEVIIDENYERNLQESL